MKTKEFNKLIEENCIGETEKEKIKKEYKGEKSAGLFATIMLILFIAGSITTLDLISNNYQEQIKDHKALNKIVTTELCYMYGMPEAKNAKLYDNGKVYVSCEDHTGTIKEWRIPATR